MSATPTIYALEHGFVQLERTGGPGVSFTQLPTLLTFTDELGWFEDQAQQGADVAADAPPAPQHDPTFVYGLFAASVGLFGASLVTLCASAGLLLAAWVS